MRSSITTSAPIPTRSSAWKPEVGGEAAIFQHVVGDLLFELMDFFGTAHQRRIHFADADEDHVAELAFEQPRSGQQGRQPRPLKPLTSITAVGALGSRFSGGLSRGRENLGQHVGFELLDRLATMS